MNYLINFTLSVALLMTSFSHCMEQSKSLTTISSQNSPQAQEGKIEIFWNGTDLIFYKKVVNELSNETIMKEIGKISNSSPLDIKKYVAHILIPLMIKKSLKYEFDQLFLGRADEEDTSGTVSVDGETSLTTRRGCMKSFQGTQAAGLLKTLEELLKPSGKTILSGSPSYSYAGKTIYEGDEFTRFSFFGRSGDFNPDGTIIW
ncbi:hypothetical protein H0X06_03370 [Candidatus Dependentiae bacterium]|nr:hypothetical protein [Candidatus Dependentiae bacterium]